MTNDDDGASNDDHDETQEIIDVTCKMIAFLLYFCAKIAFFIYFMYKIIQYTDTVNILYKKLELANTTHVH